MIVREPIGVVGAISPFNFPLNLVAHKVAPAIAAGCPVVLKPASATPLSALLLARTLSDAGLPAGFLSVVVGGGGTVGDALVEHPDVPMISFTGSPPVGWGIRQRQPRKEVGLELGNYDAGDRGGRRRSGAGRRQARRRRATRTPASPASRSSASTCSRRCSSASASCSWRPVEELVVGDPMDEATDVSALIDDRQPRPHRVVDRRGPARGGPRAHGRRGARGGVLRPTDP